MEKYHGVRTASADEALQLELPDEVKVAVRELAGKMREGLLALSVGVGLRVMDELIEEELTRLCGPRGKHDPKRSANRHGSRPSSVVLGGRKVAARRPRARTTAGSEARLRTWELFASEDLLQERTVERCSLASRPAATRRRSSRPASGAPRPRARRSRGASFAAPASGSAS